MCGSQRTACASSLSFRPGVELKSAGLVARGLCQPPQYTETIFLFLLWTGVLCMRVHVCMVAYKHVCAGTRGSQNSTSGIGTRRSSHWSRAHPVTPGIYLPSAEITTICYHNGLFTWIPEIEPRSLCLCGKHFTPEQSSLCLSHFSIIKEKIPQTKLHHNTK